MQQLWVTYIFVDNSWLHPTMSDLQKHTCTAPPPMEIHSRENGVRKVGLPSLLVAHPCVVWIKTSYRSNSLVLGVEMMALSLAWAQQRVSHGWGWGVMGAGGSRCLPAAAPRPRECTAFRDGWTVRHDH